jgi:hypothetical protein
MNQVAGARVGDSDQPGLGQRCFLVVDEREQLLTGDVVGPGPGDGDWRRAAVDSDEVISRAGSAQARQQRD